MGKSSLLNMLHVQLGSGTAVVKINFQGLSGSPHRARPYAWIAEEVAAAWPSSPPPPPPTSPWGETLSWLGKVEASLDQADRRLLVAIDEIERLEGGIREGWTTTDLLDFMRAAGDALRRVRLLLVTAYPLPRLGPHWVDRLINVVARHIEPLDEAAARALVCQPTPDFPDIYPAVVVDRILAETAGHPYLIQFVCDNLCRRLNDQGRLHADGADLEVALDRCLTDAPLFDELWRQRNDDERSLLRRLAAGEPFLGESLTALRELEREGFLRRSSGRLQFIVPLFAHWVSDFA